MLQPIAADSDLEYNLFMSSFIRLRKCTKYFWELTEAFIVRGVCGWERKREIECVRVWERESDQLKIEMFSRCFSVVVFKYIWWFTCSYIFLSLSLSSVYWNKCLCKVFCYFPPNLTSFTFFTQICPFCATSLPLMWGLFVLFFL